MLRVLLATCLALLLLSCTAATSDTLTDTLGDTTGGDLQLDGYDLADDQTGDLGADLPPAPSCNPEYDLPAQGPGPAIAPNESWKNSVGFGWEEPFYSGAAGQDGPMFIKFTVFLEDLDSVYFQDSQQYLFHYDFAADHLAPFEGLTPAQFDAVTLYDEGRVAILGAVVAPRWFEPNEVGVQLVSQDPLHPKLVRAILDAVVASFDYDKPLTPLYFPGAEQDATVRACPQLFEANGVRVSAADAWGSSGACYSTGYALGRLRHFSYEQILPAYLTGELLPTDILLTDLVPAELPILAGVVSTRPGTLNSHVAIYSQSLGTPFAWLADPAAVDAALALVDQEVLLVAAADWTGCAVHLLPTNQGFTPQDLQSLKELKTPPPLDFPVKDCGPGILALDAADTVQADAACFGGKAVGMGVLNRAVPDNSPASVALSMVTWDTLMASTDGQQRTLRARIDELLAPFQWPPNMPALDAALAQVRALIKEAAHTLPQDLQGHLLDALAGFDPTTKVRVRSSSNAEDAESFVAAGLYESFSACLADDLDDDASGPSACNPAQPEERGFFRAARKVYESFYTLDAYAERLRRGVAEADTGMALLVHQSFPDDDELANGVAVLTVTDDSTTIKLVSLPGANSVTNPSGGATPEEVLITLYDWNTYVYLTRPSNLVLLGDTVLDWETEYRALADLLLDASAAWAAETKAQRYSLDLEYKKMKPGKLVLKQLRRLPLPGQETLGYFLLPEAADWCVPQGEGSDLFALHRSKARLTLRTNGTWVAQGQVTNAFLQQVSAQYVAQGALKTVTADGTDLATLKTTLEIGEYNTASINVDWSSGGFDDGWGLALQTAHQSTSQEAMFGLPSRQFVQLRRTYANPQVYIDYDGTLASRNEEFVRLSPCQTYAPQDLLPQQRSAQGQDGLAVTTDFYWPPSPKGPTAGYTAPAVAFVQTTLTGLTTQPLVLTDQWAQTYHPQHHNFAEEFLFEPALDPAVTPAQLAELEAAGVRAVVVFLGYSEGAGRIWLADEFWNLTEVSAKQ
jgi:hypothetical protein